MREFATRWLQGVLLCIVCFYIFLLVPSIYASDIAIQTITFIIGIVIIPAMIGKVFFFWKK